MSPLSSPRLVRRPLRGSRRMFAFLTGLEQGRCGGGAGRASVLARAFSRLNLRSALLNSGRGARMSLRPGMLLAHSELLARWGAGGLGEVWRARDTKLKREVALKILPTQFASSPDRLARFEREAIVLASLNHPNIASIYELGHADDVRFLVLELVEGPTLDDRMLTGPIPVREVIGIATQIAA